MSKQALWSATILAGLPCLAFAQPLTGPYLSFGAGVNLQQDEGRAASADLFDQKIDYRFSPGAAGRVGAGYGLGNGLRVEIEGDYLTNTVKSLTGNLIAPRTLLDGSGGRERKYGGFLNVVYEPDLGLPVQPYLGVGAGALAIEHRGFNQAYVEGPAPPGLSLPVELPPASVFRRQTNSDFAYQGIAGFAVPLSFVPGLSFTAEYHFIGLLDPMPAFQYTQQRVVVSGPGLQVLPSPLKYVNVTGNGHFYNDLNHEITLGFRYALFQPPAPLPPATPPMAQTSPNPPAARTYLVFFDWDRADLTARARQIVAQAAQATRQGGTTRIEVDGYTDLSGTPAYNQRLSVRRATTVKAELMRDGVAAGEIAISGHGESNPLVPTAAGVREPQNRRVEIILH